MALPQMDFEDIKVCISSLATKFNIKEAAIFGSYARGEQSKDSDIDILISYHSPIGLRIIDLKDQMETNLKIDVDLININGISCEFFNEIKGDLVYVYKIG